MLPMLALPRSLQNTNRQQLPSHKESMHDLKTPCCYIFMIEKKNIEVFWNTFEAIVLELYQNKISKRQQTSPRWHLLANLCHRHIWQVCSLKQWRTQALRNFEQGCLSYQTMNNYEQNTCWSNKVYWVKIKYMCVHWDIETESSLGWVSLDVFG